MKLFFEFIKAKLKIYLLFLLFALIFAFSFVLYHLPVKAAFYPTLLCLLFGAIFTAFDFIRYRAKHEKLESIKKLTAAMISELPEEESIIDSDYSQIIENLNLSGYSVQKMTGFLTKMKNISKIKEGKSTRYSLLSTKRPMQLSLML